MSDIDRETDGDAETDELTGRVSARRSWRRFASTLSLPGLLLGGFFFAVSLTPSLLPRPAILQGALSGIALAIGYGIGRLASLLWSALELRPPSGRLARVITGAAAAIVGAAVIFCAARMRFWQNALRDLVEMEPVGPDYPIWVALLAVGVGLVLVLFGKGASMLRRRLAKSLSRYVPRRLANGLGLLIVLIAITVLLNDVAFGGLLRLADQVFATLDQAVPDGIASPQDPLVCGGPDSLVRWDKIGRRGKEFIVAGPTEAEIATFTGASAMRPVRISVGMQGGDDAAARAALAVAELERVGGFDRELLVVALPTGTGWLDPGAVDSIEYMHGGDTAIVSVQYSYLPSWITVLANPGLAGEAGHALFDAVYARWSSLPRDARPKLYVHGLSLGSMGSETAPDLYTIFEDPIQGCVFSGPPFPSTQWRELVRSRNDDSPVSLPTFKDGRMVRFMNQSHAPSDNRPWGPIRVMYIQYPNDPMVWFSPSLLYRSPEWLNEPRGQGVSPYLRWCPVVTFLQVGCDLAASTSVPVGYGHNYAPRSYIDAWQEVTQPIDWTAAKSESLKDLFASAAGATAVDE